jgi:signal transduction histidine kinase
MEPTRWLGAVRTVFRLPRTVRLRLAVLYGVVVLVSGGALLAITFAFGSFQSTKNFAGGCSGPVVNHAPSSCAIQFLSASAVPPPFRSGVVTIFHGVGEKGTHSLTVAQVEQFSAQLASSGTVHDLLIWSFVGLAVVTLLAVVLGWSMSGRMLRPLRTITNTTQHISEVNLHERLALAGPRGDELKELGDTIDGLLARLEAAFEAQGRFVQNASHELRTPITMMRTSLDVATGKPGGTLPEVTALAGKVGEGLDQAERLLESFLVLARVQSEEATDRGAVDLPETVATALEMYRSEADGLGLIVQRELGAAVAFGSETLLARLVGNLIHNSVRHNVRGGWLRVTTETAGGSLRLVVENGGPVLDQARADLLGQPFQRLGADRTASDRGIGLGLSIVAAITQAEGGKLEIHALDSGGLRVTVELPLPVSLVEMARS